MDTPNCRGDVISQATKESGKTITVVGSLKDTEKYIGKPGFNVLEEALEGGKWTKAKNIEWMDDALRKGDEIWVVTNPRKHTQFMEELQKEFPLKKSAFLDVEIPYLEKATGISIYDKF